MNTTLIIFSVLVLVIVGYIIVTYNRLIAQIEAIKNNQKQIDIQLDRRFKVFESLIDVVKNYMNYEQTTLKDVVALRNKAQAAKASGNEKGRIAAENQISDIASHLNIMFEQYPDLKANQNCLQLQEEIVSTENKLTYSKQAYNDSIEVYNANKKSIPTAWVVQTLSGKLDLDFPYWQLSSTAVAEQEAYKVKL